MQLQLVSTLLATLVVGGACHGDHDHGRRAFPSTTLPVPTRPLVWGDINIIHTTDTHGWLLGHQKASFPEPNYSGDFGDFASFVSHMKAEAIRRDVDLLLVDSGDLHDGTGLSDGFPPGGVDAHSTNNFFKELPYDLLTVGKFQNFIPKFNGRYLSSNANITIFQNGKAVSVPFGDRFAKFITRKGRSITSFGVLFDFTGNDVNTTVQRVQDMVKEAWFAEAIREEPDLFVLTGHMPVARDNWPSVFNAIRAVHATTPILILGGHSHVRDCLQFDGRSIALESGRYMETVGWLSAKLDHKGSKENLTFTRRFLDPNRVTFEFHTGQRNSSFDTAQGRSITKGLNNLATQFDLNFTFGTAPHDFFVNRAPFPSNDSSLSLFIQDAVPVALAINNTRAHIPNIMITNSGSQRFDIYAGPFTKNDQLTASPFTDAFLFIPNITSGVANQVLPALNGQGAEERRRDLAAREYALGRVETRYREWLADMDRRHGLEKRAAGNLTLGYVTTDSCSGVADDIQHAPLPFFHTPDFIGSNPPNVTDDTPIDLVFVDFIESQLLGILNTVQKTKNFTKSDVQSYTPILANQALGLFAQIAWNS